MAERHHTRRRSLLYRTASGEDIYAGRHHLDVETGLMHYVEVRVGAGVVHERDMTAGPWREVERTDCWCCSCGSPQRKDPACRVHGWWGRRPCEAHKTNGEENPEGALPESIEQYRDRLERERVELEKQQQQQKGAKR